jgi:hypothetical protein
VLIILLLLLLVFVFLPLKTVSLGSVVMHSRKLVTHREDELPTSNGWIIKVLTGVKSHIGSLLDEIGHYKRF